MSRWAPHLILLVVALGTVAANSVGAADHMTFGFTRVLGVDDVTDGMVKGAVLSAADAAARNAGIEVDWEALPPARLVYDVKNNRTAYCSVGLFKTAEREKFSRFSQPFFKEGPYVVLSTKKMGDTIKLHHSFNELTKDKSISIVKIDNVSYGTLDDILNTMSGNVINIPGSYEDVFSMLRFGHGDYMLKLSRGIPERLMSAGFDPNDFAITEFSDLPRETLRYFMCSLSVDDSIIQRLNDGIRNSAGIAK
jgi:polar amino acid transport system substrate-binding protein